MSDAIYLGPYRLGEEIGKGGMGTVYRAVHAKTEEKVAVKLIAAHVADSEQFRRRFASEIESLKRVDHPNIAKLIGYGEEKGRLFYAMELVEGPTLRQRLVKEQRLSWQETLDMAIEVSSALQHAHILGIIHRDLKPANLLFDKTGKTKLVDFGINKFWDSSSTVAGAVLGTADYMAPEQAGEGAITVRTDLYALGSVMYACLVGRPPFVGKELTTLIKALRHETPAPLELIVPATPDELSELVHQLLEKDPEDRPPTARAVNNRLNAIKLGLMRAPHPTHIDPEGATHVDESDTTRIPDNSQTSASDDPGQPTSEQLTLDATLASAGPPRAPSDKKVTSAADAENDEPLEMAAEPEPPPASRFQLVDEAERRRLVLNETAQREGTDWQHWLSVAALIAVLLGLVGLAVWMVQTPSADELYNEILAAEAVGELSEVEPQMKDFLRHFPGDPRADTVRAFAESVDLERTLRRLRLAAIRAGGIEQLGPAEQTFLEAMSLREIDPLAAREKLSQWLQVFGHPMPSDDDEIARLAELARLEVDALSKDPEIGANRHREKLQKRIEWAMQNLSTEEQRPLLDAVIALYEEEPWAAEAVEYARRARDALREQADAM